MKICAIICEFNPFHNGHAYLLEQARRQSGCDALVCIMSGQFTQRGEICRTDKFLRAKHAVLGGADAVIELPTPFAVAPAEIFAQGAIKTALQIEGELTLAFGCECGECADFYNAAEILCEESEAYKKVLQKKLDEGESFIRASQAAFEACGGKGELLRSPNNLLGVEYTKAIKKSGGEVDILPIKRIGSAYDDEGLCNNYSSASAIRANCESDKIKDNMPEISYIHFVQSTDNVNRFEQLATDALFLCDKQELKSVYGCTEGLENKLKTCCTAKSYAEIIDECTSKRYSSARIKRILCANLLRLYRPQTQQFLKQDLPIKVLAIKKQMADLILPTLTKKYFPSNSSLQCEQLSSFAYALWRHVSTPLIFENLNEKMILI